MIGTKLAHFTITAHLGSGGMGDVYQATDSKLGRSVAIKLLPEAFIHDTERAARFEREARVLASLNHPNIAAIYGIEQSGDRKFLVMELVPGETLAERIKRGPIPVEEALGIARQISEALEAANDGEKGIIHRDLKPANLKVTPEGQVKVLDFGLAKAYEAHPAAVNLSQSPTISMAATMQGVILGTAAYMSPEQARGESDKTDRRTDIFSFGCVLYEMLTGRQAFQGKTVSDVLASVLARDPDLNLLPPNVSPRIAQLLRRTMEKDPKRRWQAVGDLRVEIEGIIAEGAFVKTGRAAQRPLWKRAIPFAGTAIAAGVIASLVTGGAIHQFEPFPPIAAVTRFAVALPEGQIFNNVGMPAISPDGTEFVYAGADQLYLRSMANMTPRPIPGTALANRPIFSPDGQSLSFYAPSEKKLKKIAISGGAAVTLCDADNLSGASWSSDGFIYFGQGRKGILRVSDSGGKPETVVAPKGIELFASPQVLPGGDALLFTLSAGEGQVVVQSLKSGDRKVLINGGRYARYVPTGHLVYALGATLLAAPFDAAKLQLTGSPVPIVEGIRSTNDGGSFSFSNNGSMIYLPEELRIGGVNLALADRNGVRTPLSLPPKNYTQPRISPNGKQLAVEIDVSNDSRDIWVYDLAGAVPMRRLTFRDGRRPIWSGDGQRIVFTSSRDGNPGLFWQPADGTGSEELLAEFEPGITPQSEFWSTDRKELIYNLPGASAGIAALSMMDHKSRPLIAAPAGDPSVSPDGRWIAYKSPESGRNEVYVQPFQVTGAKFQVTTAGGDHPLWSPDGRQLFYTTLGSARQIVAVDVQTQPTFAFQKATRLPIDGILSTGPRSYDITPDCKQFIVMLPQSATDSGKAPADQISVTLNWFEELKQRVPVR